MSYILDALKKSDQERKQESPPNLHSVHGYPPSFKEPSPYIQPLKLVLLALVSVLFVGLGVYFFQQTEKPPTAPPRARVSGELPPTLKKEPHEKETSPEETISEQAVLQETAVAETPPEEAIPEESVDMIDSPPAKNQEIPSTPVRIPREGRKILFSISGSPAETLATPAKPSEPPSPLPLVKNLPENLRSQLPQFHFAGHTYSEDPAQRMIIINNTISREGDKIDLNTRLVEITWEGVVIDYKGIKFRVDTY